MKRPKPNRFSAGMAATVALVLVGAGAAFADTNQHNFDDTVPAYQQSHYLNSYGRTSSTANSRIYFSAIGSGQLMNVKAQNLSSGTQYTEKKGIGTGSERQIDNNTPAGTSSRLIVTNYDFNTLTPNIKGYFIIN